MGLTSKLLATVSLLLIPIFSGCRSRQRNTIDRAVRVEDDGHPVVRVRLAQYGLPTDYTRFDDDDCRAHVIGYRFVVWLPQNLVAAGFNTTPTCRAHPGERVTHGQARVLVFDAQGTLKARRDIAYDADGDDELVAPGEARPGPDGTLLFRIEEAGNSKSGVLLLDEKLNEVARLDQFLEHEDFFTHSLSFQNGFTWNGPRTYDVLQGKKTAKDREVSRDWPVGTMDRQVGSYGDAFMSCKQELRPGEWVDSNVVYAGAHRRCTLNVIDRKGNAWSVPLQQDEVAEIIGVRNDKAVLGIVRGRGLGDRLLLWQPNGQVTSLPWFPKGYDTNMIGATDGMRRYLGRGMRDGDDKLTRWMIFDSSEQRALVDRNIVAEAPVALSPDGLHYASLENGELRIYDIAGRN